MLASISPQGYNSPVRYCTSHAGCILLSNNVENNETQSQAYGKNFSLGGLDITISRNFYGSQVGEKKRSKE